MTFSGDNLQINIFQIFQGTPAKGETPKKVEKKEDKENIFSSSSAFPQETDIRQDSLVNESCTVEGAAMSLETDKYSCIAKLDDELEDEKWEERTAVITRNDHEEYLAAANSILHDLLGDVRTPVKRYVLPLTTDIWTRQSAVFVN